MDLVREGVWGLHNWKPCLGTILPEVSIGRDLGALKGLRAVNSALLSHHTFFFFHPIHFYVALLSCSLPLGTQIRGHIAGPPTSTPSPLRSTCLHFYRATRIQHFLLSSTGVKLKTMYCPLHNRPYIKCPLQIRARCS